jgi:hypothetical protein
MPPELSDPIAQQVANFALGGGALAIGTMVGRFIWKWRSGRLATQKDRNTSLVNDRAEAIRERREAERQREAADKRRRLIAEENGRLRRLLRENGIDPGEELDFANTARPAGPNKKKAT